MKSMTSPQRTLGRFGAKLAQAYLLARSVCTVQESVKVQARTNEFG